jgi:hypothetical protein
MFSIVMILINSNASHTKLYLECIFQNICYDIFLLLTFIRMLNYNIIPPKNGCSNSLPIGVPLQSKFELTLRYSGFLVPVL